MINVGDVIQGLKVSKETGSELVRKFEAAGILAEITGKKRYRKYAFREYVAIVARGTADAPWELLATTTPFSTPASCMTHPLHVPGIAQR